MLTSTPKIELNYMISNSFLNSEKDSERTGNNLHVNYYKTEQFY